MAMSKAWLAGLIAGAAGLVVSALPLGNWLEESYGLGILFTLRGSSKPPAEVVVVSLDREAAAGLHLPARPDQWPRSVHARMVDTLAANGAALIVFDMYFGENRGAEDTAFAAAINRAGNVILCERIEKETLPVASAEGTRTGLISIEKNVSPTQPLALAALATAPFPLPKVPVRMSQYWKFKTGADDAPTLPILTLVAFTRPLHDEFIRLLAGTAFRPFPAAQALKEALSGRDVKGAARQLRAVFLDNPGLAAAMVEQVRTSGDPRLGPAERRLLRALIGAFQGGDSGYLGFYGGPGTIPAVPYDRLLVQPGPQTLPGLPALKGKVVFIGFSEYRQAEQRDGFYTVFSRPDGIDLSGVEIAATAFANLLDDRSLRPLGPSRHLAVVFAWGALLGVLCFLLPPLSAAVAATALGGLYLAFSIHHFSASGLWLPLVVPLGVQGPAALAGTVLWKNLEAVRERRHLRNAMRHYLPENVVEQLAANLMEIRTHNKLVYGTCLFTDAADFTRLSESMDPKELTNFMNRYFEPVFAIVKQQGGIVSGIVGDAVLAIWTGPRPELDVRNRACVAALEIAATATVSPLPAGEPWLRTRIGVHSGYMSLGNVGAVDHYEYTPMGDIVNTASRIEGLNKQLGTSVLASREALQGTRGLSWREMGKFLFVGKSQAIDICELLCREEAQTERERELCRLFSEALCAFRARSWNEMRKVLQCCLAVQPADGPSRFYLRLAQEYETNPPAAGWDGRIGLTHK